MKTVNDSNLNMNTILQIRVLIGLMLVSGAREEDDVLNVQFYYLPILSNVHGLI